nr:hypothetical protein [Tanacetum cinerariifolium]
MNWGLWEASEDDDVVLDKPNLKLRFRMNTAYLFHGYGVSMSQCSQFWSIVFQSLKLNHKELDVVPYTVGKEAGEDDDGVLDKPSLELRSKRVSYAGFLQVLVLYVQYNALHVYDGYGVSISCI